MKLNAPVVLSLLLAGSALTTFLFWREVTFGRRLDDTELAEVLAPDAPSRKTLHGINELTVRWQERQPGMGRWTERLVAASRREEANVRRAAAWAMLDAVKEGDAAVTARLREMVASDADVSTRRNAACALSVAEDPSAARPVLRSMLEPFVVVAPAAGTVESLAELDRRPATDAMVGRLRGADGARIEAVAAVPGRVIELRAKPGDEVAAGAPLVVLAPDPSHVAGAATALVLCGKPEDEDALRALLHPGAGMTEDAVAQVRRALDAIESRSRK
jgi:hypothetical protein